jgi:hypothetical protein
MSIPSASLIRPAYKSLEDFQEDQVLSLAAEVIQKDSPLSAHWLPKIVKAACGRYGILWTTADFSDELSGCVGCYTLREGIKLKPEATIHVLLHECAHHIVSVHFGKHFEPSHGPWFASVVFDLCGSFYGLDLENIEGRGVQFAIKPTGTAVPDAIREQANLWNGYDIIPEIDPAYFTDEGEVE